MGSKFRLCFEVSWWKFTFQQFGPNLICITLRVIMSSDFETSLYLAVPVPVSSTCSILQIFMIITCSILQIYSWLSFVFQLFAASFPLAPLLALMLLLFDIRVDADRLLWNYRRPVAKISQDIGEYFWYINLLIMNIILMYDVTMQ